MGIIGYDTEGASTHTWNSVDGCEFIKHGTHRHTPSVAETISDVNIYCTTGGANRNIPVAIYESSDTTYQNAVPIASVNILANAAVGVPEWHQTSGLNIVLVPGRTYWIASGRADEDLTYTLHHDTMSGGVATMNASGNNPFDEQFPNPAITGTNQNRINSLYATTVAAGITAVSSSKGADTAAADGVVTVTVPTSVGLTGMSLGGVACSSFSIVNGTTVTAIAPRGGLELGEEHTLALSNGATYLGVTFLPPSDMSYVTLTESYAELPEASIFYGAGGELANLAIGDQIAYSNSISGYDVTMDSLGIVEIDGDPPAGPYEGEYYILDASADYAASEDNSTFEIVVPLEEEPPSGSVGPRQRKVARPLWRLPFRTPGSKV